MRPSPLLGALMLATAGAPPAAPPAPLAPQSADSALARAQHAYDSMTTLKAAFYQTLTNPMLGRPEHSRGVLFLQPPGRFAMRFTEPSGDRIVADGRWLWVYTPSSVPDQVIRQPIPTSGANTPNLFAQFVDRPLERYRASYVGSDTVATEPVDLVRLVPKGDDAPFREAVIGISRRDGWMRRLSLVEESGQRRLLTFQRLDINQLIPPSELRFTAPRGARVITPE
ncbi:MAG: outer membrane lipoprotein carrier protein LolA [Gemmatimonadetes bacterium]|nr:outer membrane lipoprotein carrier protein LolA [Gemmatimonadota bacterium]